MSEWKAFTAFAIDYLGMPVEATQGYLNLAHNSKYRRKAKKINDFIMLTGNFGHNRDLTYRSRYSGLTYKFVAAWRRLKDFASLLPVFPMDAPKFYLTYMFGKVK